MGGHQAARLVKHEQTRALARRQRLAVDGDDIVGGDIERRRIDHAAVDGDAALHDPFLGVAARGQPCPRHDFRNALARFLFARRPGCPFLEIGLALAILAAAAERRTPGEDFALILIVAARPIGISVKGLRLAARMLLPGAALFARTLEFRTVFTRTIEFRPLAKWAFPLGAILARTRKTRTILATAILARFVEIPRTIARRAGIAPGMIGRACIALLPRLA